MVRAELISILREMESMYFRERNNATSDTDSLIATAKADFAAELADRLEKAEDEEPCSDSVDEEYFPPFIDERAHVDAYYENERDVQRAASYAAKEGVRNQAREGLRRAGKLKG